MNDLVNMLLNNFVVLYDLLLSIKGYNLDVPSIYPDPVRPSTDQVLWCLSIIFGESLHGIMDRRPNTDYVMDLKGTAKKEIEKIREYFSKNRDLHADALNNIPSFSQNKDLKNALIAAIEAVDAADNALSALDDIMETYGKIIETVK